MHTLNMCIDCLPLVWVIFQASPMWSLTLPPTLVVLTLSSSCPHLVAIHHISCCTLGSDEPAEAAYGFEVRGVGLKPSPCIRRSSLTLTSV
jgi:hypothetical protein